MLDSGLFVCVQRDLVAPEDDEDHHDEVPMLSQSKLCACKRAFEQRDEPSTAFRHSGVLIAQVSALEHARTVASRELED